MLCTKEEAESEGGEAKKKKKEKKSMKDTEKKGEGRTGLSA